MAYVAVKGGQEAIQASKDLAEYRRVQSGDSLSIDTIKNTMADLIDQVMSEASLYDEDLAALAIIQARGSMEEAVFLLRAHRSTLPRLFYSSIVDTKDMELERRITASFKDIADGQYLGYSKDYDQRFLNFDLIDQDEEILRTIREDLEKRDFKSTGVDMSSLQKVTAYLESQGLYESAPVDNTEPDDITKKSIVFPASRSERLQSLTRGQTGAVTSFGYAVIRGFGIGGHPNIGELRVGHMDIHIGSTGEPGGDDYYIGSIKLTEVETFHQADGEEGSLGFELGYGLVFGQNETKAIAMASLDYSLGLDNTDTYRPTSDDEFVLLHIDSVESSGFISHLKLPHYVTFQSILDSVRSINKENDND